MTADIFIDSNIVLYAQSQNPEESGKRELARKVLKAGRIGLSSQVLGEFYVNATRKISPPLSHDNAVRIIAKLSQFPVLPVDSHLVAKALDWKKRYQVSYWDALILVAADHLHCHSLMSEDLSHGQTFGGVRVVNPFL